MAQRQYEPPNEPLDPHHDLNPLGFDPAQAVDTVTKLTRENPHAALAGAVAVGFVLGGGMTPRLMGAIAMFAARRYFRLTIEESLASLQSTIEGHAHPGH